MAAIGLWVAGCAADDPISFREIALTAPPRVSRVPAPLPAAHCDVNVEGVGVIDLEEDYLPHVITCENGGAELEALKAQAVAARSVAYYNMETEGSICDSQGCQVYSCGNEPNALAHQAVDETSGMYLSYNDTLTYAFYVAGDSSVSPPSCVGVDAPTEHWITYNEGRSGTDVEQTELGFIHAPGDNGYGQNRGCMGQWAARCLENDNGYDYVQILQFFYGADIELTQAAGECVIPQRGDDSSGGGEVTTTDPSGAQTSDGGSSDPDSTGVDPSMPGSDSDVTAASQGDDESSEGDVEVDGTAGEDAGALPDTYGERGDDGACGCVADASPRTTAPLLLLVGVAHRRRRRRIA